MADRTVYIDLPISLVADMRSFRPTTPVDVFGPAAPPRPAAATELPTEFPQADRDSNPGVYEADPDDFS